MGKIKVKAPCKINLSLKVQKRRADGFHPIESIMCAVNLFDYIEIETLPCQRPGAWKGGMGKITVSSNSGEIPVDSSNIAYKAAELFLKTTGMECDVNIYIEKNIPVCAGLAGGSTDGSAVVFGLNQIYDGILGEDKINSLLSSLGSDLNFCYFGGAKMCRGRGEVLENIEFQEIPVTLVKPKGLKISAKEAYMRFDEMIERGEVSNLPNDLEFALLPHYKELQYLNSLGFSMSGSGPVFFMKKAKLPLDIKEKLGDDYLIIENLKTIDAGQSLAFDQGGF